MKQTHIKTYVWQNVWIWKERAKCVYCPLGSKINNIETHSSIFPPLPLPPNQAMKRNKWQIKEIARKGEYPFNKSVSVAIKTMSVILNQNKQYLTFFTLL